VEVSCIISSKIDRGNYVASEEVVRIFQDQLEKGKDIPQ
jgi:hypothetical protein